MSDAAETLGRQLGNLRNRYPSVLSANELATLTAGIATCAQAHEQPPQLPSNEVRQNVAGMVRTLRALASETDK